MKSRGFRGTLPNPHQEQKVTNFHRNLADLHGHGARRACSTIGLQPHRAHRGDAHY